MSYLRVAYIIPLQLLELRVYPFLIRNDVLQSFSLVRFFTSLSVLLFCFLLETLLGPINVFLYIPVPLFGFYLDPFLYYVFLRFPPPLSVL